MQRLKLVAGVIAALGPILYCGGLVFHFVDVAGSVKDAETIGLGPTLLGLTIVGLLFCIPLLVKLVRLVASASPPGSHGGSDTPEPEFDADAAVARYMAQRTVEAGAGSPGAPAMRDGGAKRSSFGRKR